MTTNERVILYTCLISLWVLMINNLLTIRSQHKFNQVVTEALYTFCGKDRTDEKMEPRHD